MPKKQKRQVSTTGIKREGTANYTPAAVAVRRVAPSTEFKPDYTHVISDLKRIGVLAGSFFVVLIVLSFFLH